MNDGIIPKFQSFPPSPPISNQSSTPMTSLVIFFSSPHPIYNTSSFSPRLLQNLLIYLTPSISFYKTQSFYAVFLKHNFDKNFPMSPIASKIKSNSLASGPSRSVLLPYIPCLCHSTQLEVSSVLADPI